MLDPVLEVDAVGKRYGQVIAVHEVSVAVHAGEIFGLVGDPGAGATTVLRIAAGLIAPDSGQVRWRSGPLTAAARARIGYLPQRRGVFAEMKLLDHLVFLAELHGLDTNTAHRNALRWTDRLGLRPHRAARLATLPAGLRYRVELAATLVPEPAVLVLDEPFDGLTEPDVEICRTLLTEAASGSTAVLLASHDTSAAERVCDRIGMIYSGRMITVGTVGKLRGEAVTLVTVTVPLAGSGWAEDLPGCRLREAAGSRVVLELDPGTDDQAVLTAAMAAGQVTEFGVRPAGLAELYRDVVSRELARGGAA